MRIRRLPTLLIPFLALVIAAACEMQAPIEAPVEAPPEEETTVMPEPQEERQPVELDEAVRLARQDLAERLEIGPQQISLIEARRVTWQDGSLGCPEPGMMYTQALVEGYRIRLEADGRNWSYHGAQGRKPFLCPAGRIAEPLPGMPFERQTRDRQ